MSNISRRSVLAMGCLTALSACGGRIPDLRGIPELRGVQDASTGRVGEILDNSEATEIMQRNYQKNLPEDMSLLGHMLCGRFCNSEDLFGAIQNFQSQYGLTADGDIGPSTLEKIYLNLFVGRMEDLSPVQLERYEIYREMRSYPSKTRWVEHLGQTVTLHPSSHPRVFSNAYYYGETTGFPLEHAPINSEILSQIPQSISRVDPVTYSDIVNGKYILRTYIGGSLVFASYMSPGNPYHSDGHGEATPTGSWSHSRDGQYSDMYWITGASSSVRGGPGNYRSDIMPYAVNVTGGIFSHAGAVNGTRRSHGCMRLPMYYAKALYEIFQSTGGQMSWEIVSA